MFVKNGEAVTVATLLKIIQLSVKWPYNGNSDETTVYVQNKGTNLIIKGIL